MRVKGYKKLEELVVETPGGASHVLYVGIDADEHPPQFVVANEDFDLKLEGKNLPALKAEASKYIRDRSKVDWELFVHVTAKEPQTESDYTGHVGASVGFDFKFVAVGKTVDGQEIYVDVPAPFESKDDEGRKKSHPKPWDGHWSTPELGQRRTREAERPWEGVRKPYSYSKEREVGAFLPATVENVEALRVFQRAIIQLGHRIFEHLEPKKITALLANVTRTRGLPLLNGSMRGEVDDTPRKRAQAEVA